MVRFVKIALFLLAFLMLWGFTAAMFDEFIYDDFDKRPSLLIIAPALYRASVYYLIPLFILLLVGNAARPLQKRIQKCFCYLAAGLLLRDWLYLAFQLPTAVLFKVEERERFPIPITYAMNGADFIFIGTLNLVVVAIGVLVYFAYAGNIREARQRKLLRRE